MIEMRQGEYMATVYTVYTAKMPYDIEAFPNLDVGSFIINTIEKTESYVNYEVLRIDNDVNGINDDANVKCSLYMKVYAKSGSCFHFNFGEDHYRGYLHLCGYEYIENHCNLMKRLCEKAAQDMNVRIR